MNLAFLRGVIRGALTEAPVSSAAALEAHGAALRIFPNTTKPGTTYVLYSPRKLREVIAAARSRDADPDDPDPGKLEAAVLEDVDLWMLGYILTARPAARTPSWGAEMVVRAAAVRGWGPLVYDIAMERGGGLFADRFHVTPRAGAVWDAYLNRRSDVEARPLDDVEDPHTPDPGDDGRLYEPKSDPKNPLNYAYFKREPVAELEELLSAGREAEEALRSDPVTAEWGDRFFSRAASQFFTLLYRV